MHVHGTVTITRGFSVWKAMVDSSKAEMEELGMRILFAATEANDDTKLHVIMEFDSMEAAQELSSRPEIVERRKSAGVLVETSVMTPLSDPWTSL